MTEQTIDSPGQLGLFGQAITPCLESVDQFAAPPHARLNNDEVIPEQTQPDECIDCGRPIHISASRPRPVCSKCWHESHA